MSKHKYSSIPDTQDHISEVRSRLWDIVDELENRASAHDRSKLEEPELSIFDEFSPKLRATTYGTDEYHQFRNAMGGALVHHYANNDHHPEHFEGGIHDMDLVQMVEMLCDWDAATKRHDDGDLLKSIEANAERFGYGDEIKGLLINTARRRGWIA